MKIKSITIMFLISLGIVIGFYLGLSMAINSPECKDKMVKPTMKEDFINYTDYSYVGKGYINITPQPVQYAKLVIQELQERNFSEKALYEVSLGNESKFIIYECINSTLRIDGGKLYCEK